jgi:hypothetical protein
VPGRGRPAAVDEQAQAVVEPVGDLPEREDARARGGQLDRERDAVEAATDLSGDLGVAGRVVPVPGGRAGLERRTASARSSGAEASRLSSASGGTRQTVSPSTRSGARLVTSRWR